LTKLKINLGSRKGDNRVGKKNNFMSFIVRLLYNNNGWQQPTNADNFSNRGNGYGMLVNDIENVEYRYGFEEWMFNPLVKTLNIGYLESYRTINPIVDEIDKIILVSRKNDGNYYHIGNIYSVTQLPIERIGDIIEILTTNNWQNIIEQHFAALGDYRNFNQLQHYTKHWNDNCVVKQPNADNNTGFCFNIQYKKIELFKEGEWKNLTALAGDADISRSMQRLSNKYSTQTLIDSLPNNNQLKKYLQTQI
jgi:hypothetical protein